MPNLTAPIKVEQVTTTYNGLEGCACGCGGDYIDGPRGTTGYHKKGGPGLTRRLNTINRNATEVEVFEGFGDELIAELVNGNGRVTRVYFNA